MKQILYFLLILISNLSFCQSEFSIHIKSDIPVDSASISSFNLSKTFSSAFKNGVATFKVPSKSSDQYAISIKDKNIIGWFNAGEIAIYLNYENENLSVTKTINSPVYERQVEYFNSYNTFLEDKSIGTDFIKNAIAQNDQDAFILVPINHYLKLFQNNTKELAFIAQVLHKQPESTKAHSVYNMIDSRLKKLKEIKQIKLNSYRLVDTNGEPSELTLQTRKRYTILDFWFTSCPSCIKEHLEIIDNPDMFENLNAELIGISTDKNHEHWVNYLKQKNITWNNYRLEDSSLEKDLGIWSFPTYIILDEDHTILGSYSNIKDTLNALMN